MNVLKPHQKSSVLTLVEREVSQHEISRKTGVDRKTIRKLVRAVALGFPSPGERLGRESFAG